MSAWNYFRYRIKFYMRIKPISPTNLYLTYKDMTLLDEKKETHLQTEDLPNMPFLPIKKYK